MASMTMGAFASKVAAAAKKVNPESDKALRTMAQVGVGLVKKQIQSMHAVDTGTMLNSTTAERVGENTYLIGPTVDYATFVANGTSRVEARPFHIKAANELQNQIKDFDLGDIGL